MKKRLILLLVAAGCLLFSCASSSSKNANGNTEIQEQKVEEVKHPFKIQDSTYTELLNTSLMSVGNNYRLKKVIEKLRAGEKVCVACIGGSVTEGAGPSDFKDGYAYQFNKMLRAKYTPDGGKNVYFDNAALSGTPSPLGLVRYDSDVVQVLGQDPDLLVIEFAVNDGGECTNQRAFEAMIRKALCANENSAVIVLYASATYRNTQTQMKPVADYYRLPQVSLLDVTDKAIAAGNFTKEQYFTDMVHPTKEGHELMADCLIHLFDTVDSKNEVKPYPVPEEWYKAKAYTNFTRITGDDDCVKISKGSFKDTDANTQGLKKNNKPNFPQNWHHTSGKDSFVMDINCKSLLFVYKVQGTWLEEKFGKAEVYVDGKLVSTYDGGADGGWCNSEIRMLIDEEDAKNHKVEVKMAPGSEKLGFTIVAMGYTK